MITGPIIRIRPDALHINDPSFMDQLYSRSGKREKYETILNVMASPNAIIGTKDHELHRRRRAVLNPYFSKQNIRRLQPVIHETLLNLLGRMENWARVGMPANIHLAYKASTKDIIQAYAFGEGQKCLEMEDMNMNLFAVMEPSPINHLGTHFHWFSKLMLSLPPNVIVKMTPRIAVFVDYIMVSRMLHWRCKLMEIDYDGTD
jgi:hypothetical protein